MFSIPPKAQLALRLLAISMSAGLFAYLIWQVGPSALWRDIMTLGWGFTLVIALAGVSHLARAWAWRLTLGVSQHKISFARLMGLRLGAEAAGQLGILGQTFGDSIRVSRLGAEIPIASGLASITLDRGLYVVTATVTTIVGILAALALLSLPHVLRLYADLFVTMLTTFLLLTLVTMRKRWPVLSRSAAIVSRVPFLKRWIQKSHHLIQSVEKALFDFHHKTPAAFCASLSLNLAAQCMAVLEVCIILWLMRANVGFFAALVMEAMTKLVNIIGNLNPGNIASYEGGTILIGKMFGLSSAIGLALALARRMRAIFWAVVGAICLVWIIRFEENGDSDNRERTLDHFTKSTASGPGLSRRQLATGDVAIAILLADETSNNKRFVPPLARVGSLPVLLRTLLTAQKLGPSRIMVLADAVTKQRVKRELFLTGRLSACVEWIVVDARASVSQRLHLVATLTGRARLVLVNGSTSYHPSLLRMANEWDSQNSALALTSGYKPVGIYALPVVMIRELAEHCPPQAVTLEQACKSLAEVHSVESTPVAESLWHCVEAPEDRRSAEDKLNRWLVKATDGIYARLNRKISIPISRQLIKLPITANMVSIFTLGVGFCSASFFALGGYWNTLLGALLCLFSSILDGCDGEVARLKMLESDFGCWLETVCDYVFYLLLLVGMTIGQTRSTGSKAYLLAGAFLLFGAVASFLAVGRGRQRLAGDHPEQFLGVWRTYADDRRSNPILYMARHTEFMVRRCFFPYALCAFALFNIMNVAFMLSVIGANLVWPISLYSSRAFGVQRSAVVAGPAVSP